MNTTEEPLIRMVDIDKRFGTVEALRNVTFTVGHAEVMGLVGDNGAGKSTLIKILTGVFPPNRGEIYFESQKVKIGSPRMAREFGIETVYQDLALIPLMSVSRNFFLCREILLKIGGWLNVIDVKQMDNVCGNMLAEIGIRINSPKQEVATLSGGERQSIAIGRAMHFGAKLLVLDEPTAALSIKESHKVLDYVLQAKERGLSVIFITHNIYHVYSVADQFTILEHGQNVAEIAKKDSTPEEIMKIIRFGF